MSARALRLAAALAAALAATGAGAYVRTTSSQGACFYWQERSIPFHITAARVASSVSCGDPAQAADAAAISATGSGEYFIRTVAAHSVATRVRLGREMVQQAVDNVLAEIAALGGKGGMIAITPDGDAAFGFTTPAMYRGKADAGGRTVAIYSDSAER